MERPWMGRCQRCRSAVTSYTMSRFNTDLICEDCEVKERNHPQYAKAQQTEEAAVRAGNFNFPGIGKPRDL